MKLRGGEFSTGTMGNFQPDLTEQQAETKSDDTAVIFDQPQMPNGCAAPAQIVAHLAHLRGES
jgi:hypothetical protein